MFDLPAAKRIRRADLYSLPSSPKPPEPDEELTALLHSQLEYVYGPVITAGQLSPKERDAESGSHTEQDLAANDLEQGFEFRLFATPANRQPTGSHDPNGTARTPRVILDDDLEAGDQQGGFVVSRREEGNYFTAALAPERRKEQRREFEIAAVSGEEVRRWLGFRYSGLEVRWRVRVLRDGKLVVAEDDSKDAVPASLTAGLGPNWQDETRIGKLGKKGKPGKKRRIILRMKKRKGEEATERRRGEAERKKKEEKEREEAEREKRTRRNREKKVKKKMREREKKRNGEGNGLGNTEADENSEGE